MAETYVDKGPEMVRWLHERTPVRFSRSARLPGLPPRAGRRTAAGRPVAGDRAVPLRRAGSWKDRVHVSPYYPTYHLTIGETTLGQAVPQEITPDAMQRRIDNDERGMGLALGGRLLKACLDRGVEPQTGHRAVELIMEDGAAPASSSRPKTGARRSARRTSSSRPAASSATPSSSAPSCAGRAPTRWPSRPTPATA